MKYSFIRVIIPIIFTIILSIMVVYFLGIVDLKHSTFTILAVITSFLGVSVSVFSTFLSKNLNKKEALMYNIAVIGLPKSGKTTFITSMFGAVMHGKIRLKGYDAILKGNSTIDKVNENLSLLDKGIPIGSTTDQTLFAYRVNIEENSSHFLRPKKEYQIEIGDFQGEMTQELIDLKTNIWRHDSDFFNWVKKANAFVFVIDLGYYLMYKKEYVADISKSLRSAWQKIIELNDNQIQKVSKQPVILIFNKADVLTNTNLSQSEVKYLAFSEDKLPEMKYEGIIIDTMVEIERDFEDLINFFKINCKNFNYNFYSSFFKDKYDYRRGLSEICNHIFPVYVG